MTNYIIAFYEHGVESASKQIVIGFKDTRYKYHSKEAVDAVRRCIAPFVEERTTHAQVRDANGYPLTRIMTIDQPKLVGDTN